jgi:hypothetical protein
MIKKIILLGMFKACGGKKKKKKKGHSCCVLNFYFLICYHSDITHRKKDCEKKGKGYVWP